MKQKYLGIEFDSELEVDYYKYLMENKEVIDFMYHPNSIKIIEKNVYTPDFIVVYKDEIVIVETKGYNQFSVLRDNIIHNYMNSLTENQLKDYLHDNNIYDDIIGKRKVRYQKIKYNKTYGFVDWNFKNPNTIANKRKEKINEQKDEIKELREFKKDTERFYRYYVKILKGGKFTKSQRDWYLNHVDKLKKEYGE